jgi:hypothetical protein
MGYEHIDNLYKDYIKRFIMMFRDIYVTEKIHGTSVHIKFEPVIGSVQVPEPVKFYPGGVSMDTFTALFDKEALAAKFVEMGHPKVTIYGEAYGGSCQKMSKTYGPAIKFIVFEVDIDGLRLAVPDAEAVARSLGLEFVHYRLIENFTLADLDTEMLADSVQAARNGMGPGHLREGIVLRPVVEVRKNDGKYIRAKHKNPKFQETATPRRIDEAQAGLIEDAEKASQEWVTENRIRNILSHLAPDETDISNLGSIIRIMVEDVLREGAGELVDTPQLRKSISRRTAILFKQAFTKV